MFEIGPIRKSLNILFKKSFLKENSKRDNIVFTLNDEIIGFESFYFMNNNKTVARFGFRSVQD